MKPSFLDSYTEVDETLEPKKVNEILTIWTIVIMIVLALAYLFIWGVGEIRFLSFVTVGLSIVMFIVIHELLHAVGFIVCGKVTRKEVKFGVIWSQFMPYAHCKVPIQLKAYRIAIILPLILLGIIPTIYAFLVGSGYWAIIGIFMTVAAFGDVLILWVLRKYRGEDFVLDHSEKIGCVIYQKE